mmetsp:Transcript_47625/g.116696  ORF Transcript_47625/g.116696 Transcript_47625/m.116696 type:complete len:323 (+) Transcript_47625:61-1029(+)
MAAEPMGLLRVVAAVRFHVAQMRHAGHAVGAPPVVLNRNLSPVRHAVVGSAAALVIIALRFFLEKIFFPSVFAAHKPLKRKKLCENVFYTIFYVLSASAGLAVIAIERLPMGFLFSNNPMWPLWRDLDKGVPMSRAFQTYYLVELGFYVGCLTFLFLIDTRRSDFRQYVIHHCATLALVLGSWLLGYTRFGAYIIALHDVSDIFLYGAKCVHYLGWRGYDTALFVVFAITFYVTRLYMLPRIIYGIFIEPWKILSDQADFNNWLSNWTVYIPHWLGMLFALATLQILHCYWYALVVRIIAKELRGIKLSDTGDDRSDDEDDN